MLTSAALCTFGTQPLQSPATPPSARMVFIAWATLCTLENMSHINGKTLFCHMYTMKKQIRGHINLVWHGDLLFAF